MQARNVKGCTADRTTNSWGAPGFAGPVEGTGAYTGTVRSFGPKGYGFIIMEDGTDMFFNVKDCVGSKPVQGDKVKFDIGESSIKPGQKQAQNVTGGSQPLDMPFGGYGPMMGGWGPDWGGGKGWKGGWGGGCGGWDGGKGQGKWGGGGGGMKGGPKGGLKGGMMMAGGPYGGKGFGGGGGGYGKGMW